MKKSSGLKTRFVISDTLLKARRMTALDTIKHVKQIKI